MILEEELIEQKTEIPSTEKDWFLQTLVDMVNFNDISIGLTITTQGIVISGDLIGGKEYFQGFGKEFDQQNKNGNSSVSVEEQLKLIGNEIYSKEKIKEDTNPTFIHFKNAKLYTSKTVELHTKSVWWRGRISEISGFSLGKIATK